MRKRRALRALRTPLRRLDAEAVTVSEFLRRTSPREIAPAGSWINANFDTWISGAHNRGGIVGMARQALAAARWIGSRQAGVG
jgi:hypothetical protein